MHEDADASVPSEVDDAEGAVHPLEREFRPAIATYAIERLSDAIKSALDAGYRGIRVFGFARFGKTTALDYLVGHTRWIEPRKAALLRLDAPEGIKRNDSSFYRSTLTLLRVRRPTRAEPEDLNLLIVTRFIELCQDKKARLIVVFIDEAQRLQPDDYLKLASLDNAMAKVKYYLFVVFVYQRDLTGFSNEAMQDEYPPHVAGRFMVRSHEFAGLAGVEDVAYACMRYDERTEWPAGSGISFTAHYAPTAFANGTFRLGMYAQDLWNAASNLRTTVQLPTEWTWPMKSFEATVVHLLAQVARGSHQFERFTPGQLKEALHAAGFLELELSRHTYKPQGA